MLVPNVVNLDICSFVTNFKKHSGYCVWWILAMGSVDLWNIVDLHWQKDQKYQKGQKISVLV